MRKFYRESEEPENSRLSRRGGSTTASNSTTATSPRRSLRRRHRLPDARYGDHQVLSLVLHSASWVPLEIVIAGPSGEYCLVDCDDAIALLNLLNTPPNQETLVLVESASEAIELAGEVLLTLAEQGRLIDVPLLHSLTRLAVDGVAASDGYDFGALFKYRKRLYPLLPKWSHPQASLKTPRSLGPSRDALIKRVYELGMVGLLHMAYGLEHNPDKLWSLGTQVKARIALDAISKRGIGFDIDRAQRWTNMAQTKIADLTKQIIKETEARFPFESSPREVWPIVKAAGKRLRRPTPEASKHSMPSMELLEQLADDPVADLIRQYLEWTYQRRGFEQFLRDGADRIHPKFRTLVRSGRIACSNPNIQQLSRDSGVRECLVPAPGHLFLSLDYRCVELYALAAHLRELNFGDNMSKVLEDGKDIHRWCAAMIFGGEPGDVADKERQVGKILNFSIPANAGVDRLRKEINRVSRSPLSREEVEALKAAWLNAFPIVKMFHRKSKDIPDVAWDLAEKDRMAHGYSPEQMINNAAILAGGGNRAVDKQPFSPAMRLHLWDIIERLLPAHHRDLHTAVEDQLPSKELRAAIDPGYTVDLPSGRRRVGCTYTAALNTTFQGPVADGLKLALWALHRAGYRVVNVIHDEVVIETPEDADHLAIALDVREIMLDAMWEAVPLNGLDMEFAIMRRWSKRAKAVFDNPDNPTKLLPWEDAQ